MKAKPLISDGDYVVNPAEPLFGDRIPKFIFGKNADVYADGRAGMNYGAFLVEKLANKRAAPILNNLVTLCYSEDALECAHALTNLRKIIADYIEE